jgi:hypothetical protein
LFRRIRDTFVEPSERTITSFLIKEGFTDSAIPSVLKSYRETNRFLADNGVSESYGRGGDQDAEVFSDEDEDDDNMAPAPRHAVAEPAPLPAAVASAPVASAQGALSVNFDMKSVAISGRTASPRELREFITALTALADLFETLKTPVKGLQLPEVDVDDPMQQ